MKILPFSPLAFFSLSALVIFLNEVNSQDPSCTTPVNKSGLCVPIQRCRNIKAIVDNPNPPSRGLANYIRRAACDLPEGGRSVCCLPQEVVPRIPSTTPATSSSCSRRTTGSKLDLLPQDCGRLAKDRLSGGEVTAVFAYPWMAVLRYDQNGKIIDGCGGSLINERYVLTAAHCIRPRSYRKLHSVILGEHTKDERIDCNIYYDENDEEIERDCAKATEEFGVESFEYHDDYNRPRHSNDIGLLRLNRNVKYQDHIRPLCLPVTDTVRGHISKSYIITGWGTTENGTQSNKLLEATMPHVDNQVCQRKLNERRLGINLSNKQMCAGGEKMTDACKGDSGGPLGAYVKLRGARFVQYGIVSVGADSCGQVNMPGVYCRVAEYMDWILDKIQPGC